MANRRRTNKREWEWARAQGFLQAAAGVGPEAQAADLLETYRAIAGGDFLAGSTVMTVKGYIRPNEQSGADGRVEGRVGIRVCNEADTIEPGANEFPDNAIGGLADWMGWFPFTVSSTEPADTATWNVGGNQFAVDLQSARIMGRLGQTVGIFLAVTGGTVADPNVGVNYDLSVGFKLS